MNATTPSTEGGPLHARFDGPIVMIGFGSIGKGTLPLIERHIAFDRAKFVVIAPDDSDRRLLDERQIRFIHKALTKENYRDILTPLLTTGPGRGMVVNLSVDTSSVDLMEFSKDLDAFYIDTVVEPWPGWPGARRSTTGARRTWSGRSTGRWAMWYCCKAGPRRCGAAGPGRPRPAMRTRLPAWCRPCCTLRTARPRAAANFPG